MQFQEDYRTLAVISRDPNPMEVYAIEFTVDNNNVGFAVTDADKNMTGVIHKNAFSLPFSSRGTHDPPLSNPSPHLSPSELHYRQFRKLTQVWRFI